MSRILIIEDNEQNMYLTTFILKSQGHDVYQVYNGSDGIATAEKEQPDLIILDIQLPVMDGFEVARRLKGNAATKKIPIVTVTSYAMAGDKERILSCGCEGYIEKPINPDTFMKEISQFLQ